MAKRVTTRSQSCVRRGIFVCGNPFHADWGSTSSSKATSVRSSVLAVLSCVKGRPVKAICGSCKALADKKPEVANHRLYTPPQSLKSQFPDSSAGASSAAVNVGTSVARSDRSLELSKNDDTESVICSVSPEQDADQCSSPQASGLDLSRKEISDAPSIELAEAHAEIERLREEIKQYEEEKKNRFDTQTKRVAAVRVIADLENQSLFEECENHIKNRAELRSLDGILQIPFSELSASKHNCVVEAFVEALTKPKHGDVHEKSKIYQAEAMECLRAARHPKYISEFHVAFQAIAYSVTGSRLVIDMLGHLGPGGSYTLLKEWLTEMGGSVLEVPKGVLVVAFDNQQRLLKNYLSRGSNRSQLDVLTNICCCVVDEESELQKDVSLQACHWPQPTLEDFLAACGSSVDVLSEPVFTNRFFPFLESRINALVKAGAGTDEVEKLGKKIEKERNYIQCPACGACVSRKKRNCDNPDCVVRNIRQAIAEASEGSRVSTEKTKEKREVVRKPVSKKYVAELFEDSTGTVRLGLKKKREGDPYDDQAPPVKRADVRLMEPLFVNPNSHEAVEMLLRHIGKSAGLEQYEGKDRSWLAIECDGLPYVLCHNVIHKARQAANKAARANAGIPDVDDMTSTELKAELERRQLRNTLKRGESVKNLRERLKSAVEEDIESGKVIPPPLVAGEFDWVVLKAGGLHWEMKLIQSVIEVLWPFTYQAFIDSQGYTTERQQEWAKAGKDHHRAFDEMSRFIDGTMDELLLPYIKSVQKPSPEDFFLWAEKYQKNLTYSWLLKMTTTCCFALMVYRYGLRHNDQQACLLARRTISPVLFARHHPNYQLIDLWEELDLLSHPKELKEFFSKFWTFSRQVQMER